MRHELFVGRAAPVIMAMALLLALALALPPAASANGKGVTVYLGYLPEVSTWGPFEATGEAYVNAGEARAHITVDHMIYDPAIRYEVWLVRADDRNSLFSVGTFEVDSDGHADVELYNPDLKPAEFRFLVISAEPVPDDDPRPDARRTVAGVFPNEMARPVAGGAAGFDGIWAQPPEAAGGAGALHEGSNAGPPSDAVGAAPPRLPVTGGTSTPLALVLAVMSMASLGLVVAGERKCRIAARAQRELTRGEMQ